MSTARERGATQPTTQEWIDLFKMFQEVCSRKELVERILELCPVNDPQHPMWDVLAAIAAIAAMPIKPPNCDDHPYETVCAACGCWTASEYG